MGVSDSRRLGRRGSDSRPSIWLPNGFFGKVTAQIIADGQSDPEVLREYVTRYVLHRRTVTTAIAEKSQTNGEFKSEIEPELLTDMTYGPIYYRLPVKHQPLGQQLGKDLVSQMMDKFRSVQDRYNAH